MKYKIKEKDIKWIEAMLSKFDFIKWDRYAVTKGNNVMVYGWIDRLKDNYKDFIIITFFSDEQGIAYLSSSAKYSKKIHTILYGAVTDTYEDCRRVEDMFEIENCIKLSTKAKP